LEICTVNQEGGGLQLLTHNQADDRTPRWSPDGETIAFVSERDGNREIYAMAADGTQQTRLTNHPAPDIDPRWSPDGRLLAFGSGRDGAENSFATTLYVMHNDGSEPRALTAWPAQGDQTALSDNFISWLPDQKIAFQVTLRYPNGAAYRFVGVYVINLDGTGLVNVANDPSLVETAWRP